MSARDPDRSYITWRPTKRIAAKLKPVQGVLATYHDHLPMTVRQIFYVMVARLVIEKSLSEYRNLAYLLRKARRARLLPFEAIHDQGSVLPHSLNGWDGAGDLSRLIRHIVQNFDLDLQLGHDRRLVVWCEAAGMLAQWERAADPYGGHVVSSGGFDSLSDKWRFAQLVRDANARFEVLHIGDLDRHGESIFDVLAEDVKAFNGYRRVTFTRLAVTEAQVHELGLESAVENELIVQAEAIPPDVLAQLVDEAIRERINLDLMAEVERRSATICADCEAALRAAELWAAP
jgi:hypothetical protein